VSLPKAITALPWRVLVPVALVIGLGMTMWGGIHMMTTATQRWHQDLESYAQSRMLEFSSKWHYFAGEFGSYNTFSTHSEHAARTQFTRVAHHLTTEHKSIKSIVFIPADFEKQKGERVQPALPLMAYPAVLQKKLDKTNFIAQASKFLPVVRVGITDQHVNILSQKAHKVLLPYLTEARGRVTLVQVPVTTEGNAGWILVAIDIPHMLSNSLANEHIVIDQASLHLQLVDKEGAEIVDGLIYAKKAAGLPQLAFNYSFSSNWGGGIWTFVWKFDATSGGGPNWFAGILLISLGLLMTVIVGWVFWTQQSLARQVQNQVVDRTNQLEQASRRFRLITDNAYDLIAIVTTEGTIEYINSAYHRVLGYSREEMRERKLIDLLHPKDAPSFQALLDDVASGRTGYDLTFRMRSKQGAWLYLEAVAKGLHNTDWELTSIVIHSRDITSRKMYADELARSEQRFRDFADSSADWLWEMNEDNIFTYISPGIKTVLGYEPDEVIGQLRFDDLFDNADAQTKDLIDSRIQRHQPYRDLEFWTVSKQGENVCLRISGVPVFSDRQMFTGYRGAASNITAGKLDRENMYRLATTDQLTNLLNRHRFVEELERTVSLARRHKTRGVILFIDLDRFKEVNDTHGHDAGDAILRAVSTILLDAVRTTDIVARLGGDEFGIIMHDIEVDQARQKVQTIIDNINGLEVDYDGAKLQVTMSIGMVEFPQEDKTGSNLIMNADLAMYRAKDMGRNRLYVDTSAVEGEDSSASVRAQLRWVEILRKSLEEDNFELHFQPIMPVSADDPVIYEALLRIRDEEGKIGSPLLFIDAAEHFGLIQKLDMAVMERCFKVHRKYLDSHGVPLNISINLSTRSIGDPELVQRMREAASDHEVEPSHFLFEITETAALHDPRALRDIGKIKTFIDDLRSIGYKIAIDDFGSGFSSFSYIRALELDFLKIDGSFVKQLDTSHDDQLFVKSMAEVAVGMGMNAVAEFVENKEITEQLITMGVTHGQGYHIHKPEGNLLELYAKTGHLRLKDFVTDKPDLTPKDITPAKKAKKTTAKKAPAKKKSSPSKQKNKTGSQLAK
jgi:diguanylate cyclase (GGDEF)-like protein/PAS domain S-box-containing protein